MTEQTQQLSVHFKHAHEGVVQDALVLSRTPPVRGLMRSTKNAGVDPVDGSTTLQWRRRLETTFISLMESRPSYVQVRYIGMADGGREIVRVNRTATGLERVVPELLQTKGQEPYYAESQLLGEDEAAFSAVTFNREHGQVDPSHELVIRSLVPIFDHAGNRFGLIVINIHYAEFLKNTLGTFQLPERTFVINSFGDVLSNDPTLGAMEFCERDKAPPVLPQILADGFMSESEEGTVWSEEDLECFARVRVGGAAKDHDLRVVVRVPRDRLLADARAVRGKAILLSILIVLLTFVATAVLAGRFTEGLQSLTRSIDESTVHGHPPVLPTQAGGEIGALARSFQRKTQQLEESEARSRAVLDHALDGIAVIDERGRVESFNPSCEQIFGYSAEEVIGRNVSSLMPEAVRIRHDSYLENYRRTGKRNFIGNRREVVARRKDGTTFPLEISVSEIRLEGRVIFTGILRDLTEKKAQDARESLIEELRRSNSELDAFAYVASHDLKAPLRVIENASVWLEEDLGETLDEEGRENLALMRSRVKRMEKLLDDLLDYSRIGRDEDERYRRLVSGAQIMDEITLLARPHPGFIVEADAAFKEAEFLLMPTKQILLNLVNNAIKHHDRQSGTVKIGYHDDDVAPEITVSDDGPGIPDSYHEKIFEMFRTLRPRDEVEGSGMGLANVKKFVEHQGGTIAVRSGGARGAIFALTFPKVQQSKEDENGASRVRYGT